jgi:hypothetical protein
MKHKKWISIYQKRPICGSICVSRVSGEEGYTSNTAYDGNTATFRSFENLRNRLIITVWKHDEWYYQ